MFWVALFVFWICGSLSVLVDLDHIIKFYLLPRRDWRFLHLPILIIAGCMLLGALSYLGGLFLGMVLGGR